MIIEKVGLLVIRDGRLLLCRKARGTAAWILPGGKPEPGETALATLLREIAEELGTVPVAPLPFGVVEAEAAGEAARIRLTLFAGELRDEPRPQGEIARLCWWRPGDPDADLAPSLRERIVPDLLRRGLLR